MQKCSFLSQKRFQCNLWQQNIFCHKQWWKKHRKVLVINVSYRLFYRFKVRTLQITSNYLPSICKIEYLCDVKTRHGTIQLHANFFQLSFGAFFFNFHKSLFLSFQSCYRYFLCCFRLEYACIQSKKTHKSRNARETRFVYFQLYTDAFNHVSGYTGKSNASRRFLSIYH